MLLGYCLERERAKREKVLACRVKIPFIGLAHVFVYSLTYQILRVVYSGYIPYHLSSGDTPIPNVSKIIIIII